MSNFNNKSITNKGLELLSAAMAGGKLEFTRIVMGSGTYSGDIGVIESLVNQKQSLDIKSITKKGSQVILSTTLLQSVITEDFYWKEIGVYAKGDDEVEVLYMYGSATDTSFISKDMLNEKMINVGVLVSNAQNITATIDGSLVYLSRADLEAHNTSNSAHHDIREHIKSLDDNKISTSQIKNNLTETETGNVLDASQGKILADKINVCSKNKVLTTLAEVNNPNLESGIYSAEGEGVGMKFDGITTNYYYTLIVNQHRLNAGFGSQMAIPYDSGQEWGVYYRNCSAGVWQSWQELATTTSGLITLNGFTQSYTQCRVSKIGNTYTFNFSIVTTGAIPSGTVIATLPIGFYPTYNFHIPAWAHNVDVPNYVRTWVTTDGNIALHGGDALASGVQLEFSRTIVFE